MELKYLIKKVNKHFNCDITQNKRERENITKEQTGNVNEDVFNRMFDQATEQQYDFFFIYGTCPLGPKFKYRRNLDNILEY